MYLLYTMVCRCVRLWEVFHPTLRKGEKEGEICQTASFNTAKSPSYVHSISVTPICENYKKDLIMESKIEKKIERMKITNIENRKERFDTLHTQTHPDACCGRKVCNGSSMRPFLRMGSTPRPKDELIKQAQSFFDEYYTSIKSDANVEKNNLQTKKSNIGKTVGKTAVHHIKDDIYNLESHTERWEQVLKEIDETGTYTLKETELSYGAKLAWRNAPRCIGRMQWSKLQVFDCRNVTIARQMFDALCNHIKYATNKGNIRSAITVFPQRTDGKHDYKVWNGQMLMYAGYKQPDGTILGDPMNVEFTELAIKLGWKSPRTRWDICPFVLSANGGDPEVFDIPDDLVLRVKMQHPRYPQFKDLNLEWYTVPAVADMLLDVGGLEFTASPFNGWYMGTEIGARDFADECRFNLLPEIAEKLNLGHQFSNNIMERSGTGRSEYSSFKQNVTIMDHHTTAEIFMHHYENEHRVRGGCPADWVWLVPPMSGSITPVFHQEMLNYALKPGYEYQDKAWKTHVWQSKNPEKTVKRKRMTFRELARAVNFASFLFHKAMAQRIKATILYATETGRSEKFAKMLKDVFNNAFNTQVMCMSDYDIVNLEHEALILFVTSTFGNGDAPENGEEFAKHLLAMKLSGEALPEEHTLNQKKVVMLTRALSATTPTNKSPSEFPFQNVDTTANSVDTLANVRFSVFGLGSSAYPNYCAFGYYINNLMNELGSECIEPISTGDELCGQEAAFIKWAKRAFSAACETFCIGEDINNDEVTKTLEVEDSANSNKFRISKAESAVDFFDGIKGISKKAILQAKLLSNEALCNDTYVRRETIMVKLDIESPEMCKYEPGDHLSIYPCNDPKIVEKLLTQLSGSQDPDQVVTLQEQKKTRTMAGIKRTWCESGRIPACTLREAFTKYVDLSRPPPTQLTEVLPRISHRKIVDVLEEFPSIKPDPTVLLNHLPLLQPRYYSISSAPTAHNREIHLTVAVVRYDTEKDSLPREGVCSNYLKNLNKGDPVICFHRKASRFHLPNNASVPVIMIGPGTGIAPFRGFWHHRLMLLNKETNMGDMILVFGCRTFSTYLYRNEIKSMVEKGALTKVFTAFSRESRLPKKYVQDLILENADAFYDYIVNKKCHVYVCGDVSMAEGVNKTIKKTLKHIGRWTTPQTENFMHNLHEERYHEDIFGITLRTAEVTSKVRLEATKSAELSKESSS
ncbi:Nitric oxide synthase, salivary gland [Nymphon striatum]|nr:Nitric oxide synthase, salivary gland [Nymphon striatum]